MKLLVIIALVAVPVVAEAGQKPKPAPPPAGDPIAEAYSQFLLAHRLEDDNNADGAIAAYRRAMTLDPKAAEIVAALADLYMRQERAEEAIATAEQALKIDPENREAHRILGTVYAAMATTPGQRGGREAQRENLVRSIDHLERAMARPVGQPDANLRAMLARLYVANGSYDKAIPVLSELVKQEPGWQDGPTLLVEAYAAAGRGDEAVAWLEEAVRDTPELYPTLADFYARGERWSDAAKAYEQALTITRNPELRIRYGQMLINTGERDDAQRARDVLREAVTARSSDERALYLLSQAERRTGDFDAAERTARRLIAQNGRNPRGFAALAEALEERRRYQAVIDALGPAVANFRSMSPASEAAFPLSVLLPHLGFAYQQLGQPAKAVEIFEEGRKIAPRDPTMTFYLVQAHLAAKNYSAAADMARAARAARPDDLRLARLEAQALRLSGRMDQSIALIEGLAERLVDQPEAHVMLAQIYSDANRGPQAVKILQDAQTRFPGDTDITFELAAILEKQKQYAEAEAVFRQLIAKDPAHAAALNYLGYMLAERGERLGESVDLIKRALAVEPENGSYLDSLGWAYFKDGKLQLAEDYLRRAADQLVTNSVVQDHYGDVLFRLGRFDQAIEAWNRALSGDGDSIDRGDIDRKIRAARQKLPRP
jgi:tetratricopeptide (TPR) repeat protein